MRILALIASAMLLAMTPGWAGTVWRFDRLDHIGGSPTYVEGNPQIIETGAGPAVQFDGVKDALLIGKHPLAGMKTFTAEVIFRPDGGAFAQRWMHMAEIDPATGKASRTRFLFEIRVVGHRWYLDAFTTGPGYKKTLVVPQKTFPVGRWYRVAMRYDGKMFKSYVNGVVQAEAPIAFTPQGPGRTSVGVRMNHVNYFHGAVYEARFTPRALAPKDFLALPAGLNRRKE